MSELDLVFLCDTTGSMGSYLQAVKDNIERIATRIVYSEKCDVRFALVEYRDHPPEDSTFAFRAHDFTASVAEMKRAVDGMEARGGGDGPESVACALSPGGGSVLVRVRVHGRDTAAVTALPLVPREGFAACGLTSVRNFERDSRISDRDWEIASSVRFMASST